MLPLSQVRVTCDSLFSYCWCLLEVVEVKSPIGKRDFQFEHVQAQHLDRLWKNASRNRFLLSSNCFGFGFSCSCLSRWHVYSWRVYSLLWPRLNCSWLIMVLPCLHLHSSRFSSACANNGLNFASPFPSEQSVLWLFPIFVSQLLELLGKGCLVKALFSLLLHSGDRIQLHLVHSSAAGGVEESWGSWRI